MWRSIRGWGSLQSAFAAGSIAPEVAVARTLSTLPSLAVWARAALSGNAAVGQLSSGLRPVLGESPGWGAFGKQLPQQLGHLGSCRWASTHSQNVGLKYYKPTTPGFRGRVITSREGLWRHGPYKPLTKGLRKTGGRDRVTGRISVWHRGGGHKRLYRFIDFKRPLAEDEGEVVRLEYDPNRSARIALVKYPPLETDAKPRMAYILAPQQLQPGARITSSPSARISPGNTLPLEDIPLGTQIHNVELLPGKGGQLARAAGTSATLISKGADGYSVVKLPSGAQRRVLTRCLATIGALSNPLHKNRKLGKAGATRWMGRRPVVRGVAMNPVDHPHGGGRGKSKGRISQTPWGVPTKGYRTRKKRNITDTFIHVTRHQAKKRG